MSAVPTTRLLALGLATVLTATPALAQAVQDESEKVVAPEGFVLPPRLLQIAFRDAHPWTLQMNVRYNSGEATVGFGNLGNVPSLRNVPGADQTTFALRAYDDGAVNLDAARANEKDANGNVTTTPGTRYGVDVDGTITGQLIAYNPVQTREWAFLNSSQQVAGGIAMNTFSATSSGAAAAADSDTSALGFELAVSRRVYKLSEKTEINFAASVGLNDVRGQASGTIAANLVKMTDLYELYGTLPSSPYTGPTFDALFDGDGNLLLANGFETTPPLQQITANRVTTTTANGATVLGDWDLKGAYYSIRLGPQLRSHVSDRFAVMVSAGMVGAYVGTDFTVTERLDLGTYNVAAPISITETGEHKDFIVGFYGEVAAEFWVTPRTAFFAGAAYEALDDYVQTVGGRTASVELGKNTVIRIGLVTRF